MPNAVRGLLFAYQTRQSCGITEYNTMQIITALERQKHHAERVNVYLDGAFAFGLNVMDAAHLCKGQQLSEADIRQLRDKDAIVRAVDKGVQLLSYRPRSTQEIRRALQKKDLPDAVIEAAIDRLTGLGYLDDRAFARFWVENRNDFKPRGARALRYELRQKGVADPLITEVLDEMVQEDDAAYRAAKKRARRYQGSTRQQFVQKLGGFLQRRGFNYSAAHQALDQLIEELETDDPAFFALDE